VLAQTTLLVGRGGEEGQNIHESQPNCSLERRGSAPPGSLLGVPRQIYSKQEMRNGKDLSASLESGIRCCLWREVKLRR
jgi:hypothetical protein